MGKKSLSLINPDLSGLWASNHIGKETDLLSTITGAISLSLLIYPWVFGSIAPIILIVLICNGQWTISIILISLLSYPYIVEIKKWDAYIKFGILATKYFEGGVSTSFEFEIDPKHPLLICYHPHGLFCLGPYFNGVRGTLGVMDGLSTKQKQSYWGELIGKNQTLLKRLYGKALIDSKLLYAPIFKLTSTGWLHGFASAAKGALVKFLKEERTGYLMPGGFNEAALLKQDVDLVYCKSRKGFIKYALQNGYSIVPAYTFGECSTYTTLFSEDTPLKRWLVNRNIPCVIFYGPLFFGLILPHRNIGLHTIHGQQKKFPKIESPTSEDVEKYHKWFVEELTRVFDDNKWRFGLDDKKLIVL